MDYVQVIDSLSPQVYRRLLRAVELGKWPDGRALTTEQRSEALQAIIAWGQRHLPAGERVGFIEKEPPTAAPCETPPAMPLRWTE